MPLKKGSYICGLMDTYRKIIHVDMDAFFASVEQRDFPPYKGKPLVVGSPQQRGVISAASYEARKYGIHSAMSSKKALELYPELIFAPVRMPVYKSISQEIHAIFKKYTDLVEPLSIDEAYLDVTVNKLNIPWAQDVARLIKEEIQQTLNLTASAGVSYNKFLAKIASDMYKPDGLTVIHPQRATEIIASLPIEKFWGIGKVMAAKMHAMGIHRGKDLQETEAFFLQKHFGKMGRVFFEFAHGIDLRPVEPSRLRLSVGCERTFPQDIFTENDLLNELNILAEDLETRIRHAAFRGSTLVLKLRFANFKTVTRSCTPQSVLQEVADFLPAAKQLLHKVEWQQEGVRLIGISVANPIIDISDNEQNARQFKIPFPTF